jgi:hypothetical protein
MQDVVDTLRARATTHGDFAEVAKVSQKLRYYMVASTETYLTNVQKEAIGMIATKLARIVCGNPNEADHWMDIEGYARLVREDLERPT